MTAPERMTPKEHESAMITPLEAIVPLMAGALHFSPTPLCLSIPGGGQPLTEAGRQFAGVVYELAVDAHQAAWDAAGHLVYESQLCLTASKVVDHLSLCVLFARALMEPGLCVSGHDALQRVHTEAEQAYTALTGGPVPAHRDHATKED